MHIHIYTCVFEQIVKEKTFFVFGNTCIPFRRNIFESRL